MSDHDHDHDHDTAYLARLVAGVALHLAHSWGSEDPDQQPVGQGPYALTPEQVEVVAGLLRAAKRLDPTLQGDMHFLGRAPDDPVEA